MSSISAQKIDPAIIPELSRKMYEQYLDEETRAVVESLDPGDRAYFWVKLFFEIDNRAKHRFLDHLQRQAKARVTEVDEDAEDAPESVKPHSWFKTRIRP